MRNTNKKPMKPLSHQAGWTMWSMLFVAIVVIFSAYVAIGVFPFYTTNATVKNAIDRSIRDIDPRQATRTSIVRSIDQQLYVDGSHELLDYKNDLKIRRSRNQLTVESNYQRELKLFHNLYIVVKFNNKSVRDY